MYGFGYGRFNNVKYEKVDPPKSLKDVPRYLSELIGGFFFRLFYIFRLVWKTGPGILFMMIFVALFDGVMPVVGSLISRSIVNKFQFVILSDDIDRTSFSAFASIVLVLLIALFAYRILKRIVNRISTAIMKIAGEKVVRYVKILIMEKAITIDLAYFDIPDFYEKLENANREAGNRPVNILSSTFSMFSAIISIVSYIVILSTVLWWSGLVIIVVSLPSAIVHFVYRKMHFKYIRFRSKDRRQMHYFSDILVNKDMVKEIRLFNLGPTFIDRYNEVFDRYYRGVRKIIFTESIWLILCAVLSAVANCSLYAIFAWNVFTGDIMIGDYNLYTASLNSIGTDVSSLITLSATIYEGTLFIDNLISYLKVKPTVVPSVPTPETVQHNTPHTIEFRNVSFKYPATDKYVLKNVNLKFRPGETVVLVGLNGAGKTTLIKLLTRLYDPTEGCILLDGKDIKCYDTRSLYKTFGIIFQDFGKYAVTVKENIAFGNIEAEPDDERIRAAAIQGNADDYIQRLGDGYDTPLMRIFEPNGIELSIGQWQKLSVARAFYSDSDILILDEPTASLDPIAEQEIFNQFDRLRKDKTTIFVSHRLSSATVASKIVVLEYGEVLEEGTHTELMERKGRYYELFTTQANRYVSQEGSEHHENEDGRRRRRNQGSHHNTHAFEEETEYESF